MIFVRVFFVTVVIAAFVALGYAFWLTFQPLDAPPVGAAETQGGRQDSDQGERASDEAPVTSAIDEKHHEEPVLDQLRRPGRVAREMTAEARRVRDEIQQSLPPEDERTLDHAWRSIKQAGYGFMELDAVAPGEMPVGTTRGRIHASGAPAYNGGGRPVARQPGIDWYKAGGAPPKE